LSLPEVAKLPIRNFVWKFHLTEESKNLLRFYSSFIKKGDLVFDIGANYGNHASVFLELGAKIVCLEPNPMLIPFLKKRFKNRAEIVNKGVSSKQEMLQFSLLEDTGHSTFDKLTIPLGEMPVKTIPIKVVTLNSLIKSYGVPQFIKIDVEGFEYEVLRTLKTPVKMLSFEFNLSRKDILDKCLKHLKSIGYKKFNFSYDSNFKLESSWGKFSLDLISHKTGDIYVKA
jgi:FkbM family methyltransferase